MRLLSNGIHFYLQPERCSYVIRYALKEKNGGTYREYPEGVVASLGRCVREELTSEQFAYANNRPGFQIAAFIESMREPVAERYILTDGQRLVYVFDRQDKSNDVLFQDSHLDFDHENKEAIQALLQEEEEE